MPVYPVTPNQIPDFWTTYGHSYLEVSYGTLFTSGRFDSLFRSRLDVEFGNWIGRAADGARLCVNGRKQSGYARVLREMTTVRVAGPYVSDTGAHLLCWGINDVGTSGSTAQIRTGWKNNLRAVISRCRASAAFADSHASISYGAGFTSVATSGDFSSGLTCHHATTTVNANFTITIPADYKGETIALSFVGFPTATAGTVTFSGTAGLTGTLNTDSQSSFGTEHCAVVKRYVAPVTGATQTIIVTLTSLAGGGDFYFDCYWFEAIAPPPVLICNIAKLTATGYATYGGWSGTEAAKDTDVDNWNADLASIVAEFDSMVQIVDIDTALGKSTSKYGPDGVHPNELGTAACTDACWTALQNCRATSIYGQTAHFNTSSRRAGSRAVNRMIGSWYTSDFRLVSGTNYTTVSGDQFSIPIEVTGGRERWIQASVELVTSTVSTTIRWGVYDDRGSDTGVGYPQNLIVEMTAAGTLTLSTGAGVKVSPAVPSAGCLNITVNPGLYWLVMKICTVGTTTMRQIGGPCNQMPNLGTTGASFSTTGGPLGYKLTGQGTTALPTVHAAAGVLTELCPLIGVKLG